MLLFDAHLDLSMNALEWNRDLRLSIAEIRAREEGQADKPDRGRGTVSFPEMRRAKIGLCVGTMIARYVKRGSKLPGWNSPEQAWAQTQGQLAWYKSMEEAGELLQITDATTLRRHAENWRAEQPADQRIGYILSLEGADSILTPKHLERAYAQGLRAIGPAHYGPGVYAQGTHVTGGLGPRGRELLAEMERLNIICDATHLSDDSFWEALECFHGPVWASHNNCRALVPDQRQFSDDQLKALIARGAVIGAVLDAWMLVPNWVRGTTTPQSSGLKLTALVDHIDHICQLAGNALHVGIGSDLDGAYGTEQVPQDLDTIYDLRRLLGLLTERGYSPADIERFAHGNWLRFLTSAWEGK